MPQNTQLHAHEPAGNSPEVALDHALPRWPPSRAPANYMYVSTAMPEKPLTRPWGGAKISAIDVTLIVEGWLKMLVFMGESTSKAGLLYITV